MKKYLIILSGIFLCYACNTTGKKSESSKEKSELEKKITVRATYINSTNAYNNLFFDSSSLEKYLAEVKPGDSLVRRMRSFYNARNYQYAWFGPDGLTEQAKGFYNLYNYKTDKSDSLLYDKKLMDKMDLLLAEENLSVNDKNYLQTELALTQKFIEYALTEVEDGYLKRKEMEKFVPIQKRNVLELADSLVNKKHKDEKYFADINEPYSKLMEALKNYLAIAKAGGWNQLKTDPSLYKKGSTGADVLALKKRLQVVNYLPALDSTPAFTPSLETGINTYQQSLGYKPTGILTKEQIASLNIPVEERMKQLLVNLGRMQWAVHQPEGKLFLVNIPEFLLHVKEGAKDVFTMNVVVGKEGHNTTMFTGNLNQIVFSPYWNVPVSIIKKEIMPAINSGSNYIERNNMEITGTLGDGIPRVRQKPGPGNSLGKVKFLFPNSYDIYFHDTPAKSLFDKDKRAYSHGCIRLSDPEKLANYILKDADEWTPEKINAAMNLGEEKFVKVKNPIPVLITYYTAWVDDNGLVHFADDIYGHDKITSAKMFL